MAADEKHLLAFGEVVGFVLESELKGGLRIFLDINNFQRLFGD